jgi:hypothetical protein
VHHARWCGNTAATSKKVLPTDETLDVLRRSDGMLTDRKPGLEGGQADAIGRVLADDGRDHSDRNERVDPVTPPDTTGRGGLTTTDG